MEWPDLPDRRYRDSIPAIELGKAAEHLVCADLILDGYRAYLSDQGLPYDVVVDLDGRLLRIQVKSTLRLRNVNRHGRAERLAYSFHVRRRGKKGDKRLSINDCDIVALVALDLKIIAYLPIDAVGITCQLAPPGYEFKGRSRRSQNLFIDGHTFNSAVVAFDVCRTPE